MAIHYQPQSSNQFHNSWKHCLSCFSSAELTPLHEKIRLVFNCQVTLVAWDGDHGENGHVLKYKAWAPRRSSLEFSWRLLFKEQFWKREDVPFFPCDRPTNNNNELYLHDHTNTYSIAKAMFRSQITTPGNYVTLTIICHEHLNKLKYILWIVYW